MSDTAVTETAITDWIRPWYPGRIPIYGVNNGYFEGHIFPDCEELLLIRSAPVEGAGWLDPRQGNVCRSCLAHHNPQLHAEIFGDDDEDEDE